MIANAPNVSGARLFGLVAGSITDPVAEPDLAALKDAVAAGRVSALYVFDPGPDGSIGDTAWILEARSRGVIVCGLGHVGHRRKKALWPRG